MAGLCNMQGNLFKLTYYLRRLFYREKDIFNLICSAGKDIKSVKILIT